MIVLALRLASLLLVLLLPALAAAQSSGTVEPWPGEDESAAENLTSLTPDFGVDLSGAFWNEHTKVLWTERNGPTDTTSKLWSLQRNAAGGFAITGEWVGFGDLEDITQPNLDECVVYGIVEGDEQRIKAWNVCDPSSPAVLENDWDTKPYIPQDGGRGAEGLAFVPDADLTRAGFLDGQGHPHTSTGGMGGLMFVGHQGGGPTRRNGGGVFVFDLNRSDDTFTYVGEYRMFVLDDASNPSNQYTESPAVSFDQSTGLLYVFHGEIPMLTVHDLSSQPVAGESYRLLNTLRTFHGPNESNPDYEGIALYPVGECAGGTRSVFMTVDDGGPVSLLQYKQFRDGCPDVTVPTASPTSEPAATPSPTGTAMPTAIATPVATVTPVATPSPAADTLAAKRCRRRMALAWAARRYCEATRKARAVSSERCAAAWSRTYAHLIADGKDGALCRFEDEGDGTVTDLATGLQWAHVGQPKTFGWPELLADFLGALDGTTGTVDADRVPSIAGGVAGHQDWRLPSTVDFSGIADPRAPGRDALVTAIFSGAAGEFFWSATSVLGTPTDVWVVRPLTNEYTTTSKESGVFAAVAVRDGL